MHNGKEKHKSHWAQWLEAGAGSGAWVVFADPMQGLLPRFSGLSFSIYKLAGLPFDFVRFGYLATIHFPKGLRAWK